tara:strand:+ start:990 stop:1358 length:369 start_codon:yes stop_codon:yes gene_type:complete
MINLSEENIEDLKVKVLKLLAKTVIELDLKTEAKTLAAQSKILANDLMNENRFKNLTFERIQEAFHIGVRECDFEPFMNIRTYYKWIKAHKKTIDNAEYQVKTLNRKPEEVPFYKPKNKLLK